ncbi:MAG: hypothetical protein FJY43_11245 [Betaproteobacteria bacterium]|nr:hypothetical protein [Betaproteobacteria bacterium]
MSDDKTMKLVTNLDRAGIESRLSQLHAAAKGKGLTDLAQLFSGFEGMPKAAIEQRVHNA